MNSSVKSMKSLPHSDKIFYIISGIVLFIILIAVLYPLIFVLSASFSSGNAVASGQVTLLPVEFTFDGYVAVFRNNDVVRSYANTFLYTTLGTFINVAMVITCAYGLSRPTLTGRHIAMFIFTFTMFFSGGLIPYYLLIRSLGFLNTMWAMVVPGALSVYLMIIARTFIQSTIPGEILEATKIDGCSDIRFFFSFVLPLSKAIVAVIALFSGVSHWNAYFNALIFLNNRDMYPLQVILREILIMNQVDVTLLIDPEEQLAAANLVAALKYALIVVAVIPVYAVYPFVQRFFIQGVMIGSLKG